MFFDHSSGDGEWKISFIESKIKRGVAKWWYRFFVSFKYRKNEQKCLLNDM